MGRVRDAKHASVPHRRVPAGEAREELLYELKAGPCGRPPAAARPRAGNDTTVTQRPASPNAAGCRSARGPKHVRQVSDGAVHSRSLGVGTGRDALSQNFRRVRGSSFENGLKVGILLPLTVLPIG